MSSSGKDKGNSRRPSSHAIGMGPATPRRRRMSEADTNSPHDKREREKRSLTQSSNSRHHVDDSEEDDRLSRPSRRSHKHGHRRKPSESGTITLSPVTLMCFTLLLFLVGLYIWRPSTFTSISQHVQMSRDFKQWSKPVDDNNPSTGNNNIHVKKENVASASINMDYASDSTDVVTLQTSITELKKLLIEQKTNLASAETMIHELNQKLKYAQIQLDNYKTAQTTQTCPTSTTCTTCPECATTTTTTEHAKCPICPICTSSCGAVGQLPSPPPDAFYKDMKEHEKTWLYCPTKTQKHRDVLKFCPTTPQSEQNYQLSFYDQWNSKGELVPMTVQPPPPSCIQLPPEDYVWPVKHPEVPAPAGSSGTHWHNLRVSKLDDLKVFNPSAHKNLYHFDAPRYDLEFQKNIEFGEKYIPFSSKIRLALDVGSGGGSFGIWLKHKYDIQSLSIAFPDWPYCEYISERGNLCAYFDAFHAFPFAKFTFDLVHVAWVYHSMEVPDLEVCFKELYRITRPGGYMWMSDGWSNAQVAMMDQLIQILGLVVLYDHRVAHNRETYFGKQPYEVQWWTILLKPISAKLDPECDPSNPAQAEAIAAESKAHAQPIDPQIPPIKPIQHTQQQDAHPPDEHVHQHKTANGQVVDDIEAGRGDTEVHETNV